MIGWRHHALAFVVQLALCLASALAGRSCYPVRGAYEKTSIPSTLVIVFAGKTPAP